MPYGIVELQRTGRVALAPPRTESTPAPPTPAHQTESRIEPTWPKLYYEKDADRSADRRPQGGGHRLRLAGPRARAQPARLGRRRTGRPREGSSSTAKAEAAGLRVLSVAEAAAEADLIDDPPARHRAGSGLRERDRPEPAAGRRAVLRPRLQHPLRPDQAARRASTWRWWRRRAPATSCGGPTPRAAASLR